MAQELIKELISNSEQKIKCLNNILKYTKLQKQAVDEDNIGKLQEYIGDKQKEIDNIDKIDTEFATKYRELKLKNNIDLIEDIDAEFYPEIKILKDKVRMITYALKIISELETENNENLNKKFNETKSKLKNVKKGKSAVKGYNGYEDTSQSIFFNQKK